MERLTAAIAVNVILGVTAFLSATAESAELPSQVQMTVRKGTYEVVVPKPTDDKLTYEKPLPLDLLPFAIRNDKYEPMGTAFAFGKDQFITAAHVLHLGARSQRPTPVLRDSEGHVYEIDQVVKFSMSRDFVVFTLKSSPKTAPLKPNTKPEIDTSVFAVGNALGEGIIFREGSLTSETPEEQDGKWKWLRFSAAASPGNSGGPLLDKKGNVLGVVLRKSMNENLNAALPIAEVINAPDNLASVDTTAFGKTEVMDATERDKLKRDYKLPMPVAELDRQLIELTEKFSDELLSKLRVHNKDVTFPAGEGSQNLLHIVNAQMFPELIHRHNDGSWQVEQPQKISRSDLGHGGLLSYGAAGSVILFHLRRPNDVPHEKFYRDSKGFMDLMLKPLAFTRQVGADKIRITSLGEADEDTLYTDAYGRRWQLRTWPMKYNDSVLMSLSLPVPNGYAGYLTLVPTSFVHSRTSAFKDMANFINIAYQGTLPLWREYLQDKDLQSEVFSHINLEYTAGSNFKFETPALSIHYTSDVQPVEPDSGMLVRFGYYNQAGKVVWDVTSVNLNGSVRTKDSLGVWRHVKPTDGMPEASKEAWQRIANRSHPYDSVPSQRNNDMTMIESTLTPIADARSISADQVIYTVGFEQEGTRDQAGMKDKLEKFAKTVRVMER